MESSFTVFTCAACGGTFESDTSESDALAEFEKYFFSDDGSARLQVCEDCWQKVRPEANPELYADYLRKVKGGGKL